MAAFKFSKRLRSFTYAVNGLRNLVKKEHNVWIHLSVALLVVVAGFYFDIERIEWIASVLCIGLVLAAEAFNTAIERLVDFVSPHQHPMAGLIKDIAAGAVLICAITAVVVGVLIFAPYLYVYLG